MAHDLGADLDELLPECRQWSLADGVAKQNDEAVGLPVSDLNFGSKALYRFEDVIS
jgi:hypothetical protein